MSIRIIQTGEPLSDPSVLAVRDKLRAGGLTSEGDMDVRGIVTDIISDVRSRGDDALLELTARLDNAELSVKKLRVSESEIAAALAAAEPKFLSLIRRAAANIREYQKAILFKAPQPLVRGGRELGVRYTPIDRVGVCVPGGKALYPSTVLMTVVPAQVAGVKHIAIVSPPRVNGDIHPMILALAGELGVSDVYRIGGAQAVAALAFGTETVAKVDKIVGPGNAFVTEAKRQVLGAVGIDSTAGPSEVLIVADETARADWLAADLLAQAEHDPGSSVLVTTSGKLAKRVAEEVDKQAASLERSEAIAAALEAYSAIIVVKDIDTACMVANDFGTEHLQIITADDKAALKKIRHAGAVFLGQYTPVPLGDYYAGPSHVLPTGGTARFFGPLSCNDFLKASSVISYDADSLAADAQDVIDFAMREGLTAHAAAVRKRLKKF